MIVHAMPRGAGLAAVALLVAAAPVAEATWSVVAVDRATGRVAIASATCVPQARFARFPARGLMDVQAIVVPGKGVAAAQAGVDRTRANQRLVFEALRDGVAPAAILERLRADPEIERRQFGIVDLEGRAAGFSGAENRPVSLDVQGEVDGRFVYSIQGNILADPAVVHDAVAAFRAADGDLADRIMAAMEAADRAGGDRRCSCETEPLPVAPCRTRTATVAYLLVAEPDDPVGPSPNREDVALYIDVTDENIRPDEDANPVRTLRLRYDARRGR